MANQYLYGRGCDDTDITAPQKLPGNKVDTSRVQVVDNRGTEYETSLGEADFVRASTLKPIDLKKLNIHVNADPTLGKKTQGDIAVSHSELEILARDSPIIGKAAITTTYSMWPNRRVPYALSSYYGDYSRGIIAQAFAEYHTKTCVRFEPKTDDDIDYIFITPDDGCYSSIGRVGGKQNLSLTEGESLDMFIWFRTTNLLLFMQKLLAYLLLLVFAVNRLYLKYALV